MAKKKSNSTPTAPKDDTEYFAYCLVLLIEHLTPSIDKGVAFELILQLLLEGVGEDNVPYFGEKLRAALVSGESSTELH